MTLDHSRFIILIEIFSFPLIFSYFILSCNFSVAYLKFFMRSWRYYGTRLSPERKSCISVHQSLLLPWTPREVDSIFDQNFSLSLIGEGECNLDPYHHHCNESSLRRRKSFWFQGFCRCNLILGAGCEKVQESLWSRDRRDIKEGWRQEWGRGLQKICGWLFRKVLVAVLSSQPWGGEEDDEEKI